MVKLDKLPYADTSVPVERSQKLINDMLRATGAQGIQWSDIYTPKRMAELKFVRLDKVFKLSVPIHTEDIERQKQYIAPIKYAQFLAQRERSMFRAMFHYLQALLNAEKHGLMSFEEAFVGHLNVYLPSGEQVTVSEAVIHRRLDPGRALPEHTEGCLRTVTEDATN
jgi:DNA repair protein RadC